MPSPTPPSDGQQPDPTRPWLATPQPPSPTPTDPTATPPPKPDFKSQPSLTDVVTTIKPADFLSVHQTPCAQRGFLTGIGAGMGIGGLRWVLGLPLTRAANWAVGAGAVAAALQYEWCQHQRREERAKMVRMVEVYTARQAAEKEAAERRRKEAEVKKAEGKAVEGGGGKGGGWWKFW
ncbi:hypothetical protein QBC39DRAFT_372347 [Podospora conica]|nr:hypothetical protein QBC39DRAFT_372347 [Schizothecium conicum]